ncbi:MAG: hypothetical protein ACE5IL_13010 [Myxococcota bacterium]
MLRLRLAVALLLVPVLAGASAAAPGGSKARTSRERSVAPAVFRERVTASGGERYSAWFADRDRTTLYFGLSPFWHLWWATGGDARTDLETPGEHWIGRFSLTRERFLPPLRVSRASGHSRGSVWDVLVHSNGRIYYTTLFEEIGSVDPDGSRLAHFPGLGIGWNELAEGPRGHVYVTRYSDAPANPDHQHFGGLAILSADGKLLRERRFPRTPERFTAPKSLAVGPKGSVWLNTDTFVEGGEILHERIHLAPDGRVLERTSAGPELLLPAFDRRGRAWLIEDAGGALQLRIATGEQLGPPVPLGPREPLDVVQDLRFTSRGVALLALWSGRVIEVEPEPAGTFRVRRFRIERPPDCRPPGGRSVLYTAVPYAKWIYVTLFCDATVLRFPLE